MFLLGDLRGYEGSKHCQQVVCNLRNDRCCFDNKESILYITFVDERIRIRIANISEHAKLYLCIDRHILSYMSFEFFFSILGSEGIPVHAHNHWKKALNKRSTHTQLYVYTCSYQVHPVYTHIWRLHILKQFTYLCSQNNS